MAGKKRVLVTGDFLVDHHIYEGARHHYSDSGAGVKHVQELGGAALIYEILKTLRSKKDENGEPLEQFSLALGVDGEKSMAANGDDRAPEDSQAYAFWRPTPKGRDEKAPVWRVSEEMGFGGTRPLPKEASPFDPIQEENSPQEKKTEWPIRTNLDGKFDVVVISESGGSFRDDAEAWPEAAFESAEWIVLKTAAPLMEGELWK